MNINQKPTVSVVICAYNEEKYLGQTISSALKCPTAEEIIVVNDGSTDKTKNVLKSFKDKIISVSYKKNKGKGYAFSKGIKAANGQIIVMLDADLKNLQEKHLKKMVKPILKRETNFVLVQLHKKNLLLSLTGQRAYLKELLVPYLSIIKNSRYGLETYLNDIYKIRWGKTVKLSDLGHYLTTEKTSGNEVINKYIQEIIEISKSRAEIQLRKYKTLKKLLNRKEIKSLRSLHKTLNEIKDKEISELADTYFIPYLKKNLR
ncbi:glycosyltransferase family 2 protein [Patescibacteria group bacterium]